MKSLWSDTVEFKTQKPLSRDMEADVIIIGAGLAGLLTAYFLQNAGKTVIILERDRVSGGVTEYTSAKITSQHGIIYSRLIKEFGSDKARLYAKANESAIKKYSEIIAEHSIDCDFEKKRAFVYTLGDTAKVKDEAEAAKSLGIDAYYTEDLNLPFKAAGAVCFNNQAQFNPLKFLAPISETLTIFENCLVRNVEDNKIIAGDFTVKGKDVVIATHYPIINAPGYYFARMHQSRSYFIAVTGARDLGGMYLADDSQYSFRNYNEYLLIGGSGHRTGENKSGGAYGFLTKSAREWFSDCSVKYNWSAQDCMPADGVPYIGRYSASTPNMYVATGFQKWGMTSSMAAASILCDMITGRKSEFEELFTPQRFNVTASVKQLATDTAEAVSGLFKTAFTPPDSALSKIKPGHGGIVEYNERKIGVYKSPENIVYTVDVKCPHLGCQLDWNPDDLTWECPCHGSRFDYQGKLLNSPATRDAGI